MAGTQASGKTQKGSAGVVITVALVANEGSGSSDPSLCAERLSSFGAEVRRFGIEEVSAAVASGADRVVVAGGDGSIAPVAAAAGRAGLPLAVIPAGTANDFARRMGLPDELTPACRLAVRGTRTRALELGWMAVGTPTESDGPAPGGERPAAAASGERPAARDAGERPFVNVASAGLPGPAAERARSWKSRLGPLAYAVGAVSAGMNAEPLTCLVECDGDELLAGEAWQVSVACSGAFGAGSGIEEADPADGLLDVVAIEAGPRLGLVSLAYRLRTRRVTQDPRAFHSRCSYAEIQVPDRTQFNVDGELVEAGDARFTVEKDAFELLIG